MRSGRSRLRLPFGLVTGLAVWGAVASSPALAAERPKPDGDPKKPKDTYAERLYQEKCALCHDGSMPEAPTREAIEKMSPAAILASMTTGVMREHAKSMSGFDRERLANYLGAATNDAQRREVPVNRCEGQLSFSTGIGWNRWGADERNSRYQSSQNVGINADTVSSLTLQWAFGFPGAIRARSQPAVTPEAIFVGSQDGTVYALDTKSGCVWWRFFAEAEVRSAPTIETDAEGRPSRLYFADFNANVYAVEAQSGTEIWRRSVQDHPVATITGSPTLYEGRLIVPLSSAEIANAFRPEYECCTFRGGIITLDATTGEPLWRFYTVPEPKPTHKNAVGAQAWGPSGVPVWSPPTVDKKRRLIYVGTGENYSSPATELSDAIVAIHLDTGKQVWARQTVAQDAWNGACVSTQVNCPEENGPDWDFGAPPILTTLPGGKDIILAGQKSGMVFGLDPDQDGQILWQKRVGRGGFMGGVHWGMASDGETLFVGIADSGRHPAQVGPPRQGIHAHKVETGEELWSVIVPPPCSEPHRRCHPDVSAAVTATPDLVFTGALNGSLRAYAAKTGELLWRFETDVPFETVNGVEGKGGSIDSDGPVITDGMVIVNSGYDKFRTIPGNVLLVFKVNK